jgi:hypothetical protein
MIGLVRTFKSGFADAVVLFLGFASVVAVAEMAVRPFYVAAPERATPQVAFRHSSRFGWEMIPDPNAHSLDHRAPISPRGLRDALIQPEPPDSTTLRWLVLGGGSAFGVGVAEEETFASRAALVESHRLDRRIELVRGGCEGYDLHQTVRFLETEGRFYRPDVILLVVTEFDLPRSGMRDSSYTPERFVRMSPLLNRKPDPDRGSWDKLRRSSRLVHFIDGRVRSFLHLGRTVVGSEPSPPANEAVRSIDLLLGRDSPPVEAAWRTIEAELDRVEAVARNLEARVYLVALPLSPQLRRPYPRARFQTRLARLSEERGFSFVDPLEGLRVARKELQRVYLPRLPYLSANGHAIVGETVAREMESSILGHDISAAPMGAADEILDP